MDDAEGRPTSVDSYIETDQYNLDQVRRGLPQFRELIPPLNGLYDRSIALIPRTSSPVFGRSVLLCHKAFVSAAVTIGRRHPDDAGPITRRAIETASIALAVKHDPKNLQRWMDDERRLRRWEARRAGTKPESLKSEVKYPQHEGLELLRRHLGVLSDAFVHFTPEFVAGQNWREEVHGDHGYIELPYLETDQRKVEQELVMLGGIHVRILEIFDECLDGAFSGNEAWRVAHASVVARGRFFGQAFQPPPELLPDGGGKPTAGRPTDPA